jgi:hypothetical protein
MSAQTIVPDDWAPVTFTCRCGHGSRSLMDLLAHYKQHCQMNPDSFASVRAAWHQRSSERRGLFVDQPSEVPA